MTLDMELRFTVPEIKATLVWQYTVRDASSVLDAYYIALDMFHKTHQEDYFIWEIKTVDNR